MNNFITACLREALRRRQAEAQTLRNSLRLRASAVNLTIRFHNPPHDCSILPKTSHAPSQTR